MKNQLWTRGRIVLLLTMCFLVPLLPASSTPNQPSEIEQATTTDVTLEDFSDIVTLVDSGFNDFSGNMGTINDVYVPVSSLECSEPETPDCYLNFQWDFEDEGEVFTGLFFSLFGLTETLTTFDGSTVETLTFPEHVLDLNKIDGDMKLPKPRRFEEVCFLLGYAGDETLQLRVEIKDTVGGLRFSRLPINASSGPQKICWDFRSAYSVPNEIDDLDLQRSKELALIIERVNIGDGIENPAAGTIELHHIWFVMNSLEVMPTDDEMLLAITTQRAYQYFLDWSSRKPASKGIPQDRSTFGDLLTVAGIGFGLPAHIIAAEREWITREEAAERVLAVLKVLDDSEAFGPEPVGRIGYKGWFYHFLGVDGRRKLNFDFPDTPQDESLNTVELSSIDTGLALMGVLAAQSYFDDPNDGRETEIRNRAQSIYDRVEWDFMLESDTQQFYLGWKPDELYEGPPFEIPDGDSLGYFSGTLSNPHTLDYYTDEALIIILLASASETHPVSPDVYHRLITIPDENGLVKTWPGALFTYQFLPAFLDMRTSLTGCQTVNWFENTRMAIWEVISYAESNPKQFSTYGENAWGISAAEGPFDSYHAYGAEPVSISPDPEEDGSVTYYAMVSSISFGDDLRQRVISALRAAWEAEHWHPRFGLPDAFHAEISEAAPTADALRQSGQWKNRALFAIDQGPMLLHLENARSGLVWELMARNPNIQRGLERIKPLSYHKEILEGEDGTGDGIIKLRSNAWGEQTVWLQDGETRTWTFTTFSGSNGTISVRYSNDNFGPSETISLSLNNNVVGQFTAQDTGDSGEGWNNFVMSELFELDVLESGSQLLTLSVSGGDGYGIEIDAVVVDYWADLQCSYLPLVFNQEP